MAGYLLGNFKEIILRDSIHKLPMLANIFPLLERSNKYKKGEGVYADRKMNKDIVRQINAIYKFSKSN